MAETLYPSIDVNFQLNQEEHAGQTVGYAHFHVVTRRQDDGLSQF